MLHVLLWALLAIIVAGGLCALAAVFLPAGEQIAPPLRDEPVWTLPRDRGLYAEDIDTVRLPVALRGYRFAETDLLLDRLADEIRVRDVELTRLRGSGGTAESSDEDPTDPVVEAVPVAGPLDFGPVGDETAAPVVDAGTDHLGSAVGVGSTAAADGVPDDDPTERQLSAPRSAEVDETADTAGVDDRG